MKILIKNGRVIDPSQNLNAIRDVLITNGKITKVEKNIKVKVDQIEWRDNFTAQLNIYEPKA